MGLHAILADVNSAARCLLARSSLCEAEANLFAFPGGDEHFSIRGLSWVVFVLTLASTFSTTFLCLLAFLLELFFLGGTGLWLAWLPRKVHF